MHYGATWHLEQNKIFPNAKLAKDDQNRQVSIFEKSPKMCDIFNRKEARKVLADKHIAVIGGSNMRGLYKDIIWLLNDNSIIPKEVLGDKAEANFPNFDGPKWKGRNRISARIRKKFDGNRDILLKNQGKYLTNFVSLLCKKQSSIFFLF